MWLRQLILDVSPPVDHYQRLGLPRRFSLDRSLLEREYLSRSRLIHPDFHSNDSAKTAEAAALNEAYVTLRDPFRRAEYLLSCLGGPTASEEKGQDADFLMEMMDLRERIEAYASADSQRHAIQDELNERRDQLLTTVGKRLDTLPSDRTALSAIRKDLNAIRTLHSLLRQLDDEQGL
jgi:molecular chaperone HscB